MVYSLARAHSSVGRATALQAEGLEFESPWVHMSTLFTIFLSGLVSIIFFLRIKDVLLHRRISALEKAIPVMILSQMDREDAVRELKTLWESYKEIDFSRTKSTQFRLEILELFARKNLPEDRDRLRREAIAVLIKIARS